MKSVKEIERIIRQLVEVKLQIKNCQAMVDVAETILEGHLSDHPKPMANYSQAVNNLIITGLQSQIDLLMWTLDGDNSKPEFSAGGIVIPEDLDKSHITMKTETI